MKSKTSKYILIFVLLGLLASGYFIGTGINEYREHRREEASKALGIELEKGDVKEIDKAWEKIDESMGKLDLDSLKK